MSLLSTRGRLARFARFLALGAAALAFAAGAAGPKAYVGNFKDSTVSVIDTASGAVVATIPVAAGPHGMAVSGDGRFVWVTGDGSSSMSVIDTASDSVAQTIEVGATPHGIALVPDGKTLLVGVYGADQVAFVDTASRAVVASVAVAKPHTIAVRPDGKVAYVASQQPGQFALVVIDLATRAVVRNDRPRQAAARSRVQPRRQVPLRHRRRRQRLARDRCRQRSADRRDRDRRLAAPRQVVRGRAGRHDRRPGPGRAADLRPGEPGAGTRLPGRQAAALDGVDGKTVWVTNEGSNDVSAVDLASGKTTTIAVGNAPRKIVVQPVAAKAAAAGGATVSIANFAFAPTPIAVAVGSTVTWSNDDGAPHALAFADGAPASDLLLPGQRFARTFAKAGTFDYVCSVHPYMTGTVTVRP